MGRIHGPLRLTGSPRSSRVAQWTQRSFIKSIQRGTITIANATTSNTATIAAVSVSDSVIAYGGSSYDTDANLNNGAASVTITNATTITATRSFNQNGTTLAYEVIEYQPGVIKSIQRGTIALAGVVSNTATVTTVNTLKSMLMILGFMSDNTDGNSGQYLPKLVLTNATTITATKGINTSTTTVGYQLVEYF